MSQWERGVCFPDICTVEPLTKELGISLSELFANAAAPATQKEEMDMAISNTLTFAQENLNSKIKRCKVIGGVLFALPLFAFLAGAGVTALLIRATPQAAVTQTAAFVLLALGIYLVRLGLPLLLGYSLFLFKGSRFMNAGTRLRAKNALCLIGAAALCVWLYESLSIILPNLLSR